MAEFYRSGRRRAKAAGAMTRRLGIDLGGTKVEGAVVDADGAIVRRRRVPTPRDDYPAICAAIAALACDLEDRDCAGAPLGVGMPGIVSPATGLVKNANTTCLNGHPFDRDLAAASGRAVRVENDANCLALSEARGGAADGADPVFAVIIGTGTGGAVYANGALVRGAHAIAGEWGHNPVPWRVADGRRRRCYCGAEDCVETWLSGPGLVRTYRDLGGADAAGVEDIVAAAAAGATIAAAALEGYYDQLAACLVAVVNVLDPAMIVLGGGVGNLPGLCGQIAGRLPALAFSDVLGTRVVLPRYGDSSGVRGAACLWTVAEAGARQ